VAALIRLKPINTLTTKKDTISSIARQGTHDISRPGQASRF
jgi:hypothetical protein